MIIKDHFDKLLEREVFEVEEVQRMEIAWRGGFVDADGAGRARGVRRKVVVTL